LKKNLVVSGPALMSHQTVGPATAQEVIMYIGGGLLVVILIVLLLVFLL